MCLLTHERYKTYQRGFSFGRLGHAPGVGLRGTAGGFGRSIFFFSKFNQIWCVSYLHEWHMHPHHFLDPRPLGPWGGAKRSNIIKSELQSQFQRFLIQTLCIFSQMKKVNKQCLLDTPHTVRVSEKTWQVNKKTLVLKRRFQ